MGAAPVELVIGGDRYICELWKSWSLSLSLPSKLSNELSMVEEHFDGRFWMFLSLLELGY